MPDGAAGGDCAVPMASKKTPTRKAKATAAPVHPIPADLQVLAFPIAKLAPDPHNARGHGDRNLEAVRSSLQRFGWRSVIVARRRDRVVLAGNARVECARALGWTEAPVLFVDDDEKRGTAFAIADNRTAELADWKLEELAAQLATIAEDENLMDAIGFSDAEVEHLLAADLASDVDDDDEDAAPAKTAAAKPAPQRTSTAMTKPQHESAMAALEVMRRGDPTATFGRMVAELCDAYVLAVKL